jgi:hypothetical protein
VVPVFDIIFVHLTTLLSDIRSDPILRPTLSLPISPFPDRPPSFLKPLARNIFAKEWCCMAVLDYTSAATAFDSGKHQWVYLYCLKASDSIVLDP